LKTDFNKREEEIKKIKQEIEVKDEYLARLQDIIRRGNLER